jgi:hypothetical protein
MLVPMAALAAACVALGLAPAALMPALSRTAAAWARIDAGALAGPAAAAAGSGARVSAVALGLVALAAALWVLRRRRLRDEAGAPAVETWGCGFAAGSARIQYTGSSFAELLLGRFSWVVSPQAEAHPPAGPFPREAAFRTEVPDPVLDLALAPAARAYGWIAARARGLGFRRVQLQMLLVLATLVAVLAWGLLS